MTTANRLQFRILCGFFLITFISTSALSAWALGEDDAAGATPPEAEAESASAISGSLNLDFNTNFMSYGFDVWQRGTFKDQVFNPSFDLNFDLGDGFNAFLGTWWDVNNNASTTIGQSIQEVDVWAGVGYTWDIVSVSMTYQEWMYAGDSERILDIGIGVDTLLSPTLTIHNRVDGNGGQKKGTVFVLGASHSIDVGPVTVGASADLGLVTSGYYVQKNGGFGYFAAGLNGSIPISFIPAQLGDWSLNGGLTYYYTDDDNVGNNNDNILTGMAGISLAF